MGERLVDIPGRSQTREWLTKAKGDMTYDEFFTTVRRIIEMVRLPPLQVYTQTKNEDGHVGPLQLRSSNKDGRKEVKE